MQIIRSSNRRVLSALNTLLIKSRAAEALLVYRASRAPREREREEDRPRDKRRPLLKATRCAVENIARRRINIASVRANNKIVKVARGVQKRRRVSLSRPSPLLLLVQLNARDI